MTIELEQEFFKVFGIEPKIYKTDGRDIDDNGDVCSWYIEEVYPEITDKLILEMIIMYLQINNLYKYYPTIEDLKNDILKEFITRGKNKIIKHQIQQLFKGGE